MDALRLAAMGTSVAGVAVATIATVALVMSARDVANRLFALGAVFVGMLIIATGAILFVLWATGAGRLPILAAVFPLVVLGFSAIRMRIASARAFAAAREAHRSRDIPNAD